MQFLFKPQDLSPSGMFQASETGMFKDIFADCEGDKWCALTPLEGGFETFFSTRPAPPDDTLVCSTVSWEVADECCREGGWMFSGVIRNATTGMEGACVWPGIEEAWRDCIREVQAKAGKLEQAGEKVQAGEKESAESAGEKEQAAENGDLKSSHNQDEVKTECTPWSAFLAARVDRCSEIEARIDSILKTDFDSQTFRRDSDVSLDGIVVYSTADLDYATSVICCQWAADNFLGPEPLWHRTAILEESDAGDFVEKPKTDPLKDPVMAYLEQPEAGACVFRKDQAEEWDIYDSWWTKCVRWARNYPVHLRNVTLVSRNNATDEADHADEKNEME